MTHLQKSLRYRRRRFTARAALIGVLVAGSIGVGALNAAAAPTFPVTGSIPIGPYGVGAVADTSTGIVYVAVGPTVVVADEATNNVITTINLPAPTANSNGIAIDQSLHHIYVTRANNSIDVIDTNTNTEITSIATGKYPGQLAVDPITHSIYVAFSPNYVGVWDGVSYTGLGGQFFSGGPAGLAIDPAKHLLYVALDSPDSVVMVDIRTDTVVGTIPTGLSPVGIAVDLKDHNVYIANSYGNTVTVADGTSHAVVATIPVGGRPMYPSVDPTTHTIYVNNAISIPRANPQSPTGSVSVIDGATNSVYATVSIPFGSWSTMVDPVSHRVFVTHILGSRFVDVITPVIDSQAISFLSTPPASAPSGSTYEVASTGGASGNPVTFTVDATSTANCSLIDHGTSTATVTFAKVGTCTVDAGQDGNIGYSAAPQVQQQVSVTPGPVAALQFFHPDTQFAAGVGTYFIISGQDAAGNELGNPPPGTTLSITPDGTCFQDRNPQYCVANIVGPHTVTATNNGVSINTPLSVVPGDLYRLSMTTSPTSIVAGASTTLTANGLDAYDNVIGNVTTATTFTMYPDGTCTSATCSATAAGYHWIVGTDGNATGVVAPFTVNPGPSAVLSPTSGSAQYTATSTSFASPLVASVTDQFGNPEPGAQVTFSVSSGSAKFGTQTQATVTADANGTATSPTLKAGTSAGPVSVTATSGAASARFVESVTTSSSSKADLSVTASAPATVTAGSTVTLSATVKNLGPSSSAAGSTVIAVPAGFTVTGLGGGTKVGSTVVFTLSALAKNATKTLTLTLTANQANSNGTFRASAVSANSDTNAANNTATAITHIN